MDVLYRYKYYDGQTKPTLETYQIIKRTRCGVWISLKYKDNKFINLEAHKKWACETKEEALDSFKRRKYRQLLIILGQLEYVKLELWSIGLKYQENEYGEVELKPIEVVTSLQ
jgi:hypothetical protein